ncbi:hypothetical protein FDH08_gp37 [Propionibacterium phage B22]|uniref:Uncharacterized protein n=1 Tax=Propionibacterium phage B22 TaxID=1897532 RepID=A0A1D8ETM1_9CAUD|nr:hypothetical protein FDH08_gp37 [Propionibacterium phage B22]AOT24388.1 hypothetical protein B22_37 [Propionibacterium phage B22]CEH08705.1 Protein of unknown function [Propionibacterium freudenreichii]SBW77635.1 Hypothetical protein PFR_JS22-1_1987 [Propionibacterium freudenreichii]SCP02331.1 Hypothetical protein PFR_JS22-PH_3 [Propionibacterium freudenreichii]
MRPPAVETPDVKAPATPAGSRLFKAVRPDGFDFHSGTVRWLPADGAPIPEGGWLVEHPHPGEVGSWDAAFYLSASSVETDCTGFQWPALLLSVEPVGAMWTPRPDKFPRKRAAHAWRVIEELPAWRLFGPQGRTVLDIIEQTAHLTKRQIAALNRALDAARDTVWDVAWNAAWHAARVAARVAARGAARGAARYAAWDAARGAAWYATWVAARGAALGWLVKDLISVEDFRTLTGPWEQVMGPIEVAA